MQQRVTLLFHKILVQVPVLPIFHALTLYYYLISSSISPWDMYPVLCFILKRLKFILELPVVCVSYGYLYAFFSIALIKYLLHWGIIEYLKVLLLVPVVYLHTLGVIHLKMVVLKLVSCSSAHRFAAEWTKIHLPFPGFIPTYPIRLFPLPWRRKKPPCNYTKKSSFFIII